MLNFENLDKMQFSGIGKYEIPEICSEKLDNTKIEWTPFNFAKTCKEPQNKGLHFFIDDYQFARLWNRPDDYIPLLQRFYCVCSPDFSTYIDMPVSMQIYNHYRKHWIAKYWQMHGIKVIPTISWSNKDSFDWCFDGEPTNSIVAISSVGTQKSKESMTLFLNGYEEMLRRLKPTEIVFYGNVPEECDWNVRKIAPYYKKIEEARKAKCCR